MKSAGWKLTIDGDYLLSLPVILSSLSCSMLQFAAPPVRHLSAFMYDDSHGHMQLMETQQVNIRRREGAQRPKIQTAPSPSSASSFTIDSAVWKVKPEQQLKSRRETR